MTPAQRARWFVEAFKRCEGGVAVIPNTDISEKEMRKYWPRKKGKK